MAKPKPKGFTVSPTKDKQTVGGVRVTRRKDNQWLIRYFDPATGRDVRRRLNNPTHAMLEAAVNENNRCIMGERGIVPGWRASASGGQTLKDALLTSIRKTDAQAKVKTNYGASANRFILFMADKFPAVKFWADVKPGMISDWVADMRKRELAFDTIRITLEPVRRASKYWHNEAPDEYRDVYKAADIKLKRPVKSPPVVLTVPQAVGFLEWLRVNAPALHGMATLQAMCGLRMYEAAFLRQGDIDFNAGTLRVDETEWHKPKNNSSYRTIPVPRMALDVLQVVQALDPMQPLFTNSRGMAWKVDGLAKAWRVAMAAAREECAKDDSELDLPAGFIAKNLRHSFATIALQAGAGELYLKRFMGHSANSVLGNHYLAVSTDDLQREVTDKFVAHWRKVWQQSGNSKTQTADSK